METNFISYLRVSTARQGQSGLGLEAQREAVARHISTTAGRLVEEFVEVESGRLNERPVLRQAMAACRRTGSTLAIAKLDRLARSVHFISGLMESKVSFVAVDMPFATPLILHVMAAFAEFERDQIASRTKAALAAAKARGVKLGTNGANLARANKASAQAFAEKIAGRLEEVRVAGAVTLQEIADGLNRLGVPTREGSRWMPTSVRRVAARLVSQQVA